MRVVAILAAALLLTACPGNQRNENVADNEPSKASTSVGNPHAVPEKTATGNPIVPTSTALPAQHIPAAATASIQVQLIEYEIRMPDTIPAGPQTFHIANGGHYNHNFAIEGNGVSQKLANDLTRGDTADMNVNLKPGTYTVYCPVDKHRARGMQRTITVR